MTEQTGADQTAPDQVAAAPIAAESALLLGYLDTQRRHVLGTIEGLDEVTLHRAVLPSGWNCVGLLHHLALDVERFWFRAVVAAEQDVIAAQALAGVNAWDVGPDVSGAEVIALYRDEIERADAIIRGISLDAAPAWWPDFFGEFRMNSLRKVILHVLVETAAHAGHLDATRELIDGKQWLVLTD